MTISKTKKQEDSELISLIKGIEKEKNKIKVIDSTLIVKKTKENDKGTLNEKNEEKPCFEQENSSYLVLIQDFLNKESFYLSPKKFDYDDYKINNEKSKNLNWNYNNLEILSRDKPSDVHVLDNQDVDYIIKTIKFEQIKGNSQGDNLIPEGIDTDKWEKFCCFKKLNSALMVLMYELQSLS